MAKRTRGGRSQSTPAQRARMNNDQLSSIGYIRVAGFMKNDGTKVKSHIRKLNSSEKTALKNDNRMAALETVVDFTPIIGDVKAFKETGEAFARGDHLQGGIMAVGSIGGLIPIVGDVFSKSMKQYAKKFRVSKISDKATDRASDMVNAGGKLKTKPNPGGAIEAAKTKARKARLAAAKVNKIK